MRARVLSDGSPVFSASTSEWVKGGGPSRHRHGSGSPTIATILVVSLISHAVTGCAGYQVGPQALYRPDIRTVHVPIFQSDTFRRNLGEWLTEAIIKEIEATTTYKVVGHPAADSILEGRILRDKKRVLARDRANEASNIEFSLQLQIRWTDSRGAVLIERSFGIPSVLVSVHSDANLVPLAGQSIVTAEQEVVQRLASEVVGQMELPW